MTATTSARVLGDIDDGAVTFRPSGITIPSDITDGDLYRDLVRAALLDGLAVRQPATGDVTLTGDGMGLLAELGGAPVSYRIDIYAGPHRLTDVHLVDAPDGFHAVEVARIDLAAVGGDYAEVFQGDGAGGCWFYTTVKPAPVPCGRCRLMLADPGNAWCADCRSDDDPAEYVAGIRVSSGL